MTCALSRLWLAAGLMTVWVALPAEAKSSNSGSSSAQASLATVERQVSKRIRADQQLAQQDINVSVDRAGEATLTGTVTSQFAKDRAGEIAGRVEGVTQVDNRLEIRGDGNASGDHGQPDGGAVQSEIERGTQGAKETMADSWITTRVKSALVTAAPEASHVGVETHHGVVTLSGTVASEAIHQRTVGIARNADGVRKVVDKLKVAAPEAQPTP